MKENKTEYFLRNINAKLSNFNKWVWFIVIQWLVALPFFLLGIIFKAVSFATESGGLIIMSILFYILGFVALIVCFVRALKALYKSTKDIE